MDSGVKTIEVMEEAAVEKGRSAKGTIAFTVFCCAVGAVLAALYFVSPVDRIPYGELAETDCYVHLTKARELYQSGDWYHPAPMKSNTPYGDTLPWTRVFDVVLLAGALPGTLLTDFDTALWWWGVIVSPVLMIFTLLALRWAVRPILNAEETFLAAMFFLLQLIILGRFQAGTPDHHGLLLLLFILLVGFGLRLTNEAFRPGVTCLAGMTAGFAVWASIESMVIVCLIIAALGVFWIIEGAGFLKKNLFFSVSLFVSVGVCLLLERPLSDLGTAELDRISIVYLCLFGLIALFWEAAYLAGRVRGLMGSRIGRICFGAAGAALALLGMWVLYPKFFRGPLADMDPRLLAIWFKQINEIQPLLSSGPFTDWQVIGQGGVCILWLAYIVRRDRSSRNGWIFLGACSAGFFVLSLYQVRWTVYIQTLLSIAVGGFAAAAFSIIGSKGPVPLRAVGKAFIVLFLSMGFGLLGFAYGKAFDSKKAAPKKFISTTKLCAYLNTYQGKSLRILTDSDFAGEILYRTGHEVVSSNYHRNTAGILDDYAIMTARRDEDALDILRKRGIDVILIYPQSSQGKLYAGDDETETFYERITGGQLPAWLEQVTLPEELAEHFVFLKINYGSEN